MQLPCCPAAAAGDCPRHPPVCRRRLCPAHGSRRGPVRLSATVPHCLQQLACLEDIGSNGREEGGHLGRQLEPAQRERGREGALLFRP